MWRSPRRTDDALQPARLSHAHCWFENGNTIQCSNLWGYFSVISINSQTMDHTVQGRHGALARGKHLFPLGKRIDSLQLHFRSQKKEPKIVATIYVSRAQNIPECVCTLRPRLPPDRTPLGYRRLHRPSLVDEFNSKCRPTEFCENSAYSIS